jgi:hypothetical protein
MIAFTMIRLTATITGYFVLVMYLAGCLELADFSLVFRVR